jgi:large subunit ribosomal protein L25
VASERVQLLVQNRPVLGSAESRRLRRRGLVPGVLYGHDAPVAISIPERDLRSALTGDAGANAVLDVVVEEGKAHASVLKDFQRDPVRGTISHVDLQEVRLDQAIHATVPVHLVGEAVGSKEGGVLNQVVTEITVEALPLDVPSAVDFDVSELAVGAAAHLGEIALPEGVRLLDDPEAVLASVTQPTRVEEPEVEVDEGEEAAAAEGEAPEAQADAEAEPAEGDAAPEE